MAGDTYGKQSWDEALAIELKFEGGKVDDPVDPGGRTNQGVIQRVYAAYRKSKGLPPRDVYLMENHERDEIYWNNYGKRVRYDELPPGVNIVVVDGAINSGPGQSVKWLQRALGLNADGVLGDITLQATIDYPDHDNLIAKIIAQREKFLRALKTFWRFGKGWISRITQLKRIGQSWAVGSVGPAVVWAPDMNRKATIAQAKPKLSTAPADATAAGGTVSTTLTTVQGTLEPLQGSSHLVDQVLMAILVLGVLATVGGLIWAWYARRKNAELDEALQTEPTSYRGANDNQYVPTEVMEERAA